MIFSLKNTAGSPNNAASTSTISPRQTKACSVSSCGTKSSLRASTAPASVCSKWCRPGPPSPAHCSSLPTAASSAPSCGAPRAPRNDQPAVAPERLDVDRAECAAHAAPRRVRAARRWSAPSRAPTAGIVRSGGRARRRDGRRQRRSPSAYGTAGCRAGHRAGSGPSEGPARLGPRHPHVRCQGAVASTPGTARIISSS